MFIGTGLDVSALRARLDQCLLTDTELLSPLEWGGYEDPFPPSEEDDKGLAESAICNGSGLEFEFVHTSK